MASPPLDSDQAAYTGLACDGSPRNAMQCCSSQDTKAQPQKHVPAQKAGMGKRPLEAWQAVIDTLGLQGTAEQLYAESEPQLTDR